MPPIAIAPRAQPDPFAGQNVQAFENIFRTLTEIETIRQNRIIESNVLAALARGASAEELMEIAGRPVQFDTGLAGIFQRMGAKYARPPIRSAMAQAGFQRSISPHTEKQKLMNEGYSESEAEEILDIRYGKKPRASSRLRYEDMSEEEKLNYLLSQKVRAEGQYYGIEGGNKEPRDPKALEWIKNELEKLSIYKQVRPEMVISPLTGEEPTTFDWRTGRQISGPGTKKEASTRQDGRPAAPDTERLINAVGRDNAQMEIKAWGVIYDAWDGFPRKLQDAIRQAEQKGISFTEIMMFDEVSEILNELVK